MLFSLSIAVLCIAMRLVVCVDVVELFFVFVLYSNLTLSWFIFVQVFLILHAFIKCPVSRNSLPRFDRSMKLTLTRLPVCLMDQKILILILAPRIPHSAVRQTKALKSAT